jgi:hypothetical protein
MSARCERPLLDVYEAAGRAASRTAIPVAAEIAREDAAALDGGAAALEILRGPALARRHVLAEPLGILSAAAADNVGHTPPLRQRYREAV